MPCHSASTGEKLRQFVVWDPPGCVLVAVSEEHGGAIIMALRENQTNISHSVFKVPVSKALCSSGVRGLVVARTGEILPVLEAETDPAFGPSRFSGGGGSSSTPPVRRRRLETPRCSAQAAAHSVARGALDAGS